MARAETAVSRPHRLGFLATLRNDAWWIEPALIGLGMADLLRLAHDHASSSISWDFEIGPYLSPVFEPKLFGAYDSILLLACALVVLIGPIRLPRDLLLLPARLLPLLFLSPPACAVGDCAAASTTARTASLLILQNLHRFFMYIALALRALSSWYGAVHGFLLKSPRRGARDGFGVGSAQSSCVNAVPADDVHVLLPLPPPLRRRRTELLLLLSLDAHPQEPLGSCHRLERRSTASRPGPASSVSSPTDLYIRSVGQRTHHRSEHLVGLLSHG